MPETPSQRLCAKRPSLIEETITIACPAFVPVDMNVTEQRYQPFHSETTLPAPAVPVIDPFVRLKF